MNCHDSVTEHDLLCTIDMVLKQWSVTIKEYYALRSEFLDEVVFWFSELLSQRWEISSGLLSLTLLKDSQQAVNRLIDLGNYRLRQPMIIRDEEGHPVDSTRVDPVQFCRDHQEKEGTLDNVLHKKTLSNSRLSPNAFALSVKVRSLKSVVTEHLELNIGLYDSDNKQFFTEFFHTSWKNGSFGESRRKAIFKELGRKDSNRQRIHVACLISKTECSDKQAGGKLVVTDARRPVGVATLDVTQLVRENSNIRHVFSPLVYSNNDETLQGTLNRACSTQNVSEQGLTWDCKFMGGSTEDVFKSHPEILSPDVIEIDKIGLPDSFRPDWAVNNIYLTLLDARFTDTLKSNDKFLECTVTVCLNDGTIVPDCIDLGREKVSHYHSVIYEHPRWNEMLKVTLPVEQFIRSHLVFAFKQRTLNEKTRPFLAFAFCPLMVSQRSDDRNDATTIQNCKQTLNVYRLEQKRLPEGGHYLVHLPAFRNDLPSDIFRLPSSKLSKAIHSGSVSLYSIKDFFSFESKVVSTKLTHDSSLMNVLKWRHHMASNPKRLKDSLIALTSQVESNELIKFLRDLLDAFFEIFLQKDDPELEHAVFNALVHLISQVNIDNKYKQFVSVLQVYIDESFSAMLAYNKLMIVFRSYCSVRWVSPSSQPTSPGGGKETYNNSLFNAVKSLEYLFKFIVKSRSMFASINGDLGQEQFEVNLKSLLDSLTDLMKDKTSHSLRVQGAILKNLPSVIDDVIKVFPPDLLSDQLMGIVGHLEDGRLVTSRIQYMSQVLESELFKIPEARALIVATCTQHIKELLERRKEQDLRACIDLLALLMTKLHSVNSTGSDDLICVCFTCLRPLIQMTHVLLEPGVSEEPFGSLARNLHFKQICITACISILSPMDKDHYSQFFYQFTTTDELHGCIQEMFDFLKRLISCDLFPAHWMFMCFTLSQAVLKALNHCAKAVQRSDFSLVLWESLFDCYVSLAAQPVLQLERYPLHQRGQLMENYNDIRVQIAIEVQFLWSQLSTTVKSKFIPSIIRPIIQLTLLPQQDVRNLLLPLIFDLMKCEFFEMKKGQQRDNFEQVERYLVEQLDAMIDEGYGDRSYIESFVNCLTSLNSRENNSVFRKQADMFLSIVGKLFDYLMQFRQMVIEEKVELMMNCLYNLLLFYNSIDRTEMYVRYLDRLFELHEKSGNLVEAGLTLLQKASRLAWTDDKLPDHMKTSDPAVLTHRQLKEKLYSETIDLFDRGDLWECGLKLCKELAHQYENETFDYHQLSKLHSRMANFYQCIMRRPRPEPEYFRVGFYGNGYPPFLRNQLFVYRGKPFERLGDFSERIESLFDSAQIISSLEPPSESIKNSTGMYIQINSVQPLLESSDSLLEKGVYERIVRYYEINEIDTFIYSRPLRSNEVEELWLERTIIHTTHKLPGLIHCFPVERQEIVHVNPLDSAIETMKSTNRRLSRLIEFYELKMGTESQTNQLNMLLNGILDAAVNGGIAKYRIFFCEPSPQYSFDKVGLLKQLTSQQMILVEMCLDIHEKRASAKLQPLQRHLDNRFCELKGIIENDYNITITPVGSKAINRMLASETLQRDQHAKPRTAEVTRKLSQPSRMPSDNQQAHLQASPSLVNFNKDSPPAKPHLIVDRTRRGSSPAKRSSMFTPRRSKIPIELTQELTFARPKRPPSRPLSHASQDQLDGVIKQNGSTETDLNSSTASDTAL